MQPELQPIRTGNPARSQDYAAQQHRVLRNTYWLLALSMVPTVLGA
jgi:FtsH-binding integral membrane protein